MKQLCESHYDDFDVELTNNLVQFATNEMFKSSDSQFPASDMLIILGRGRSDQVKFMGRIWLRVVLIGDRYLLCYTIRYVKFILFLCGVAYLSY